MLIYKKHHGIIILSLLFTYSNGLALGESGTLFLTFPPSARAEGMSGAFTAIANDVSAMFYNPAGLTQIVYGAAEYNYNNWIPPYLSENSHHFLGGVYHLENTTVIGAVANFHSYGQTGSFGVESEVSKPYDKCFSLSVAQKFTPNISYGLTGKYIRLEHNFGEASEIETQTSEGWAMAIDLGLLCQNLFTSACYRGTYSGESDENTGSHRISRGFSLGISLQNIGPGVNYKNYDQTTPLPQRLRLGVAWNCVDTQTLGFTLSCDAEKLMVKTKADGTSEPALKALFTTWADDPFSEELKQMIFHSGLEARLFDYGALRFGIYSDSKNGIHYSNLGFSLGPEVACLSMSTFITEGHKLFEDLFFSVALTY